MIVKQEIVPEALPEFVCFWFLLGFTLGENPLIKIQRAVMVRGELFFLVVLMKFVQQTLQDVADVKENLNRCVGVARRFKLAFCGQNSSFSLRRRRKSSAPQQLFGSQSRRRSTGYGFFSL
jgi:hypothetical protein